MTDERPVLTGIESAARQLSTSRRIFDFRFRRGIFLARGEGVFLFSRPDRARIDLYVGAADLVFQYYRSCGRSSVILPAEGRIIEGRNGLVTLSGIDDLEAIEVRESELMTLMLGLLYEVEGDSGRIAGIRGGKKGYLLEIDRDGEIAYVQVEAGTYLPSEYQVFSAGEKRREMIFSSFETLNGIERPRSMIYRDHRRDIELRISVRNEAVNENIRPELFDPPPGWGDIE